MKLKNLTVGCPTEYGEIEITDICHRAQDVKEGSLFFCLDGSKTDGHDYAQVAAENGAAAVVCSRAVSVSCPQIICDNTRAALAKAAAAYFGNPSKSMKMFAVTGTNGKTTTSYILAEILKEAGEKVGLIGTNCIRYGDICLPATLTTPDPMELNGNLADMKKTGVTCVVMEVSAHALALDKTAGIVFDVAGFTNLSQDHLDYFGTMENYADAKLKLFMPENCKCAAVNADDSLGRKILRTPFVPTLSYGRENPADVFGIDLRMSVEGLSYIINIADDIGEVKFAMPGSFNMYNTLCAAAMAKLAGVGMKEILQGIRSLRRVDGRYNIINADKFSVIVDFAHTDDGLRNIITSVREFAPARIICVFGCGGNRDKSKRAAMGYVASSLSDLTIITSDNPRDEAPEDIISDAYAGVPERRRNSVLTEADRKAAISLALSLAGEGDVIVVAGKGAERYQEIKGVKYEYNDEDYIMRLLQSWSVND